MQHNEARYKYGEELAPQDQLASRKKELEEEFQYYLKKNSQPATSSSHKNKTEGASLGLKSLLDEFRRENSLKEMKCKGLSEKHFRNTVTHNPGRVVWPYFIVDISLYIHKRVQK